MKKLFGTMAVAAALFAGYSAYEAQNGNDITNFALANVEALAQSGEYEYPNGAPYSFICGASTGKYWWGETKCSRTVITCQGGGTGCNTSKCPLHG